MTNTDVFIEVITSENKDQKERNDARRKGKLLSGYYRTTTLGLNFNFSDIIRCPDRISKEASVKRSK